MPTQNQPPPSQRDPSRTSQGQKPEPQAPRRGEDPQGQQPQRDKQRQAGTGNPRTDRPEVGNPVPPGQRKPRDPDAIDDPSDIDDTRRANDEDVERESDRPNPRLQ